MVGGGVSFRVTEWGRIIRVRLVRLHEGFMAIDHPAAVKLKEKFPAAGLKGSEFRGQVQIAVLKEHLLEVVTFLKNEPSLAYDMLADVTCVDYLNYAGATDRFGLLYIFNSVN